MEDYMILYKYKGTYEQWKEWFVDQEIQTIDWTSELADLFAKNSKEDLARAIKKYIPMAEVYAILERQFERQVRWDQRLLTRERFPDLETDKSMTATEYIDKHKNILAKALVDWWDENA